jgi:hypothetical protein
LRFERRDWKNEDDVKSIIPKSCGVWDGDTFLDIGYS